ncbi:hypothetical protein ES703_15064 [subsurface metagenome]
MRGKLTAIALLVVLTGISFGIGCAPQLIPPRRIGISSLAERIPTSPSYLKITTPAADSNRLIYLDGCYVGTVKSIDSISMFTGPHSISFFSEWEKRGYRKRYNMLSWFGIPIYVGDGDWIVAVATWDVFIQPGRVQTFHINYSEVARAIEAAKRRKINVILGEIATTVAELIIITIVLGSSSGE